MKKLIVLIVAMIMELSVVAYASPYDYAGYNLDKNLLYGLDADNVYISAGHTDSAPADIMFDGRLSPNGGARTRWCVDNGKQNGAYMIVNLEKYHTFDKFIMTSGLEESVLQSSRFRLHSFKFYYWNDYEWINIPIPLTTDTSQRNVRLDFELVTSCKIKIESVQNDAFRVEEIGIMAPGCEPDYTPKRIGEQNKIISFDKITVNGKIYEKADNKVVYRDDESTIFISSKEVKNFLPVDAKHDNSNESVTFKCNDKTVTFKSGKTEYEKNGKIISTSIAPYTDGTVVFIPIRDIVRSLGYMMSWDGDSVSINIYDPRTILAPDKGVSPYKVEIGDEEQTTFSACNGDFVQYECKSETENNIKVRITFEGKIDTVDIRPQNRKIESSVSGNTVTFNARWGEYLSVDINGELERPLFVFMLNPIVRPDESDPNVVFLDRDDVYDIENIEFYDGMTLYLGYNVVLYTELWLYGVNNVKIIGNGIILSKINGVNITSYVSDGIYIDGPMFPQLRNWHMPFYGCNNVTIKNVRELACTTGGDGMDFIGTSNVLVDHVFIKNQDDAIAIKTRETFENSRNIEIKNSVIWTMKSGNGIELGFEMNGFGEVSNVRCSNIDFIHRETDYGKNWRAALSIHHSGNDLVENITYEDIRVEESDEAFLCMGYFFVPQYYYDGDTPPLGVVMRNITFKNVTYNGKKKAPSYLYNVMRQTIGGVREGGGTYYDKSNPDYKITMENIVFDNVKYQGTKIDSLDKAKECGFMIEPEVDVKFK